MVAPVNSTDEELAASFPGIETPQPIKQPVGDNQPDQQSVSKKSYCTPFRAVIALILISAAIALAASGVFSKDADALSDSMSDFDLFDPSTWVPRWLDHNPHGGDTPYDFNVWDTQRSCKGLDLHIIDNLDDKWQPYFERAIDEWGNGDPNVLNLSVRKPTFPDPGCEPIEGVMKVCNGDYGETDWIGVNHISIRWNYIISSIAIMNDWHLDKMSEAAHQNTMCHELGHGFGLGHWDENFYNRDLGNCMDYTKKHENNQSPDRTNFIFLEQMYGNTDGTSRYYKPVNGTEGLYCASTSTEMSEIFKRRNLRSSDEVELTDEEVGERPFSWYAKHMVADHMQTMKHPASSEERYLRSHHHKKIRVQDFGNGVKIVSTYRLS